MLERYLKTYNEQVGCADMHFNRLHYLEKPVFTK
jgi:hypothetical protein